MWEGEGGREGGRKTIVRQGDLPSLGGAEMMTFLAPPFKWRPAFSVEVKTPVDSQT
jgi:hypothetical protein